MTLRRLRLALWCACALLGVQVLAPMLAQWHGTLHAWPAAHAAAGSAGPHDAAEAAEPHDAGLQGHTPGSAECRLWDQLLAADAPPAPAPQAQPAPQPATPATVATAGVQPAPLWGRIARAPPGLALQS